MLKDSSGKRVTADIKSLANSATELDGQENQNPEYPLIFKIAPLV